MKNPLVNKLTLNLIFLLVFILLGLGTSGQDTIDRAGHEQIVQYLEKQRLITRDDIISLWTTSHALDTTHVIRHMIKENNKDIPFPFVDSWIVMIDDNPGANFGHPVRWVFIDSKFTQHSEVLEQQFPPIILSEFGRGKPVLFKCWGHFPYKCEITDIINPSVKYIPIVFRSCKYAILVSGGISSGMNYGRYAQNIKSMFILLRNAGFAKSNIYVYYADGNIQLDCDNEDSDNNDATGNDVTDGAFEDVIRARFQSLSSTGSSRCRVLFSYFTNHGADNTGVCLWDVDGDGLDNDELYSPAELSDDILNSRACRHFMIHDQCYSGDFLSIATDGNHDKLSVYAAASASELSWGREYMAQWEQNDIKTIKVNDMHQDVVNNGNLTSTPGMTEGTAGIGDYLAGRCCCCWWWWRYWYIIIIIITIGLGIIVVQRRFIKK
jgi:hypothetical protein